MQDGPSTLSLIGELPAPAPRPHSRLAGAAIAALLLVAAGLATKLDADASRSPLEPRRLAAAALDEALARGSDSPAVRSALLDLRRIIGRAPLEARTRVVYASLLLGVGRRIDDPVAAAFHAARAAELSPVRLSVVAPAATVLARSGERAHALSVIRSIFAFDAEEAAELLAQVEPLLLGEAVRDGLADRPSAFIAWSRKLQATDRDEDGLAVLEEAHARWPADLAVQERLAAVALRRGQWERLASLFAGETELPDRVDAAGLLLYRSIHRSRGGDASGARDDVERAMRLDGDDPAHRVLAGEAYEALGDYDLAQREWTRALYAAPAEAAGMRARTLTLLARMAERNGNGAEALRHWQALLARDASHLEARRRIQELSGGP